MQRIVTRAEWGARPPTAPGRLVPAWQRTTVMLHHSGGAELGHPDEAQWVRQIQAFHIGGRGWADIAYNALVGPSGTPFEGRDVNVRGAHCYPPADPDYNTIAWSICLLNAGPVTEAQRETAIDLCRLFAWVHHGLVPDAPAIMAVSYHRKAPAQTECPGDDVAAWVDAGMPDPRGS